MPRFACPSCKQTLSAPEEERGAVMTCPGCNKRIRIPGGKPASVPPTPAPTAAPVKKSPSPPPMQDQFEDDPPVPKGKRRAESTEEDDFDHEEDERPPKRAGAKAPLSPRGRPAGGEGDDDIEDEDDEEVEGKRGEEKKGGLIASIFGGIGALLALGIFILVISGKWVELIWRPLQRVLEEQGIHPIFAIGITAAVFLIPLGLYTLVTIKSAILRAMPEDLEFHPAEADDIAHLDQAKLAKYSDDLEALGFRPLRDYTIQTDTKMPGKGFARLFVHDQKHCFAEANQVCAKDRALNPMRCHLMSLLDDGWSVSVGNRAPSKEMYLMRRAKGLWQSRPDENPKQLLTALVEMRDEVTSKLNVDVETELSEEAYFRNEKKANRERKDAVRKRWSAGILLEMWLFDRNPKYEWLGKAR